MTSEFAAGGCEVSLRAYMMAMGVLVKVESNTMFEPTESASGAPLDMFRPTEQLLIDSWE